MRNYRCATCGKLFDPEKNEICPACGTAVAPSALTRVERKQTAARLRAEGMTHYDDHCHEDDAWKGSYGAQTHRSAVRSHEQELRANYNAHSGADVTTRNGGIVHTNPTRVSNANAYRNAAGNRKKKMGDKIQEKPALMLLIFFFPALLAILMMLISMLFRAVGSFSGLGSFWSP